MNNENCGLNKDRKFIFFVFLGIACTLFYKYVVTSFIVRKYTDYLFLVWGLLSLIYILAFSHYYNPFKWTKELISSGDYKRKKWIALVIGIICVVLKIGSALKINRHGVVSYAYLLKPKVLLSLLGLFFTAGFEEVFTKGCLLRIFDEIFPRFISFIIIALLMVLIQLEGTFIQNSIVFVGHILFLSLFSLYPSILFVTIIQFCFNIVVFL